MKYSAMRVLAGVALLALQGLAGSASATTVTSPSGTIYTKTVGAESEGMIVFHSSFIGVVECKSKFQFIIEKHGFSVPAGGKVSAWTFTECKGGEGAASATSPVAKPGSIELHGTTTTGNGTVTSSGLELILHHTLAGTCVLTTETSTDFGTLTGSNVTKTNATIDIGVIAIRTSGSGFCGESVTMTGNFKVWQPSTLEVH